MEQALAQRINRKNSDRFLAAVSLVPIALTLLIANAWLSGTSALMPNQFATIPLIAVVVAFIEIRTVRIRVLNTVQLAVLDEFHLVAGFLFAGATNYLWGALLGVTFATIFDRERPSVIVMNSAWFAFGVAGSFAVGRTIVGEASPFGVVGLTSVVIVLLIAISTNLCMMSFFEMTHNVGLKELIRSAPSTILGSLLTGTIAYFALWIVNDIPVLSVGAIALAAGTWIAVTQFERLRNDREGMLRLHETTSAVQRMPGAEQSLETLLNQALKLSDADEAEILIIDAGSPFYAAGSRDSRPTPQESTRMPYMLETLSDLSRNNRTAVADDGWMASLIGKAPSALGLVSVRRDNAEQEGFRETDRKLFEMFVNHAAIALENSQLFIQLRNEMDERKHEALHDQLTGLPNRSLFDSEVRRAVAGSKDGTLVGVVLSDIDGFKEVNDTLGHHHGDELLKRVAERVSEIASDSVIVARLGGDEFAAIVKSASDEEEVLAVANALRSAIEEPFEVAEVEVHVVTSLGVTVCDHQTALTISPEVLLQQADVAMYSSKESSASIMMYDSESDPYSPDRLVLAAELRGAVANGEIVAHFQPELDIANNTVVAVEALARWEHPVRGSVYPDQFIPIAEASGLIKDLTYSILDQSLEQVMKWRTEGHTLCVAVNLSVRCLQDENLVRDVKQRVERSGVDPSQLILEITEGTIMADPENALKILTELHELGIKLSIDDFGTGYSSLTQLKRLPVCQVKIDRSFVTNMPTDSDDAAIARLVVELGHALDLRVIAEGIEDAETLQMLNDLGCDLAQGYFIKRPARASDISAWLRERARCEEAFHRLEVI